MSPKRLAACAALTLILAACADAFTGPTTTRSQSAGFSALPGKADVCHRTGSGEWNLINVALPAVAAHLKHGDGQPAGAVDGNALLKFGADCVPGASVVVTFEGPVGSCQNVDLSPVSGVFSIIRFCQISGFNFQLEVSTLTTDAAVCPNPPHFAYHAVNGFTATLEQGGVTTSISPSLFAPGFADAFSELDVNNGPIKVTLTSLSVDTGPFVCISP